MHGWRGWRGKRPIAEPSHFRIGAGHTIRIAEGRAQDHICTGACTDGSIEFYAAHVAILGHLSVVYEQLEGPTLQLDPHSIDGAVQDVGGRWIACFDVVGRVCYRIVGDLQRRPCKHGDCRQEETDVGGALKGQEMHHATPCSSARCPPHLKLDQQLLKRGDGKEHLVWKRGHPSIA
jgi:hypothetical protein